VQVHLHNIDTRCFWIDIGNDWKYYWRMALDIKRMSSTVTTQASKDWDGHQRDMDLLKGRLAKAVKRNGVLVECWSETLDALMRHGRHRAGCPRKTKSGKCNCIIGTVVEELRTRGVKRISKLP